MRRLSEERTKILFEKLTKYIGPNVKLLIERPDGLYCFREQKDRIYYVSEKILKLAYTVPTDNIISVGTCFGKFTKSNKFRLNITALNYLAPYAQSKIWLKPAAEQQFLYGNHIAKAGLGRISENTEKYQGVVVYSMSDLPLGFGVAARSTAEWLRVKSGEPAQCTMRWLALMYGPLLVAAIPRFDPSALLREVLIPADAAIGTVIYRLRASDPAFNYPLQFTIQDQSTAVYVDSLNCTRFNSVCQANIVLQKRLEIGRFYDFRVRVLSQRGEGASLNCSFRATNATTPIEKIFPGAPTLLMVSERSRRNTELGTVIGKGHPKKNNAVLLELWGARQFGLHQKLITDRDAEGTILLLSPLDYEIQTVHHLTILANDPWTELETDTRNIAGWPLLVAVLDEQDTPPVFTLAPPTTTLSPSLQPGDLLLRVNAEDGDRGNPRPIRYGLVPDSNPFVSFFNMSEDTGELFLSRPLSEILSISHSGQPILLKVVAEEVRSNPQEAPAQSSTVQLALIPPGVTAGSPTFGAIEYNAIISENSPTGTLLNLAQAEINTQPGDVVTLTIEKNNNTFDISPGVVEGHAKFQIRVHDPRLLDYEERHSVQCYLVAKEIGTGNFTARAKLTVLLTDLNDNPPSFVQDLYVGNVQEHSAIGTTVLRVEAYDMDREPGNKVRYVNLTGVGSGIFNLAEHTGLITVADPHNLDAEMYQSLTLKVAAADEDGQGLYAWATIKINILDVNDHEPICAMQEFIISPERNGFTSDGIVRATDADATSPNNQVQFEITDDVNNLSINKDTGQLYLTSPWTKTQVFPVKIRVYDGGIPRNSVECEVRIYPAEGMTRRMTFIVPGGNPDRAEIARTLATLTGGKVTINNIRPYDGDTDGATDISRGYEKNRSVVDATIRYAKNSVIDVDRIQQILDSEYKYKYSVKREEKIRQSSSSDLLWLLILLIILAIITAIVLILCCICKPCPFYIAPKRRKIVSADIQEKLVVKGSAQGHESKSVQVAEWFGRKEAWSPEPVMIDAEVESLRRHEVERGSDRGGKRTIHRQGQIHREASREQLYIREGNTDILRLITRGGGGDQRVLVDPVYMPDSGKDALMRRFIDQQQAEALRTQTLLPNAVNRLQTEHELLEASLRQQNALLRQIILDRERDLRLETQSLPAGTQTDQDMSTQTEPQYLRPPRRRVQSDNDVTDEGSDDDELALIKARIRQRNNRRVTKSHIKRKIKTPIQEESEIDLYEKVTSMVQASSNTVSTGTSRPKIKQTKTSEMRQKRASSESRANLTKSALRKEVLREITASLERTMTDDNQNKAYDSYTDDSLEDISPRSEKTTDSSGKVRYHSESDLRLVSNKPSRNNSDETAKTEQVAVKSQSQSDLTNVAKVEVAKPKEKKATKRGSRYMEWYDKKNSTTKSTKQPVDGKVEAAKTDDVKENNAVKEKMKTMSSTRLMKDTESSSRKKVDGRKSSVGPEHPLLQHSEHRFEAQYPMNVRRPEEDTDSGIAMTRPPMAQKKSVFTIAYNDIHTSQLRPDSTTPPL